MKYTFRSLDGISELEISNSDIHVLFTLIIESETIFTFEHKETNVKYSIPDLGELQDVLKAHDILVLRIATPKVNANGGTIININGGVNGSNIAIGNDNELEISNERGGLSYILIGNGIRVSGYKKK